MAQARANWDLAEAADTDQIARELSDLEFLVDQWPENIKNSRKGQDPSASLPSIPARPCLTIDTLRDPIAHVAAEAQQTDLGPEIVPADDFLELVGPIDETEIELREGLVRRSQRDSDARDARNWAADRARKAGRGYYLVMTRFVSKRSMDQEVYIERLMYQANVRLDPRHEKPDGSDCEWEFWGSDKLSWEAFKAKYPNRPSKRAHSDDEEWRGLGQDAPDWFTSQGETKSVRVMNYMHTVHSVVTLVALKDGTSVPDDKKVDESKVMLDEDGERVTREYDDTKIYHAVIDGSQVLSETEWPSPHMPIVKVLWEEIQPFDSERRVQGMVRPARDPAFGVSVMATTEVEVALLAPKTPVIGVAGQFEGYEEVWDQLNVRNIGRAEYNAYTDAYPVGSGPPLPQPTALVRNTEAAVGTWDGLRSMFMQAVKSTTGVPDATLGNVDPSVRSGRGIRALIEQSRQGTSGGLNNLVKSVTYEAKIVNSLLYPIYGRRPGRLMQMMTGKYEAQGVIVGKPFVRDQKQRPVPFDPAKHGTQQPTEYKLTEDASFNVAIRVSKDWDTRRQEEASTLGELLQANPVLMSVFGDLFFENQDGPGHKEMAKRAKIMLDPRVLQSLSKESQQIPPEVQAQLMQMQQHVQELTQALNTDQAKQQATVQSTQIKAQSDQQSAQAQAQIDVQLQQMKLEAEIRMEQMKAEIKAQNEQVIEQMKLDNAIQLQQMKDESAERIAETNAKAKASQTRSYSLKKDAFGNNTAIDVTEGSSGNGSEAN